jgi:hypothetical protein
MKSIYTIGVFILFLNTIKSQISTIIQPENRQEFVEKIKKAHHFDRFHSKEAIVFDIEMTWGGKPATQATLTTLTSSGKVKFQTNDGKIVVFDGKKMWLSSNNADYKNARFDIFMYHYFFMIPFKVQDKGTNWQILPDKIYDYNDYARAKLTFGNNTGDSPDDWYIVHRNKATNYLEALTYIVTYGGKAQQEAEKKPGGITYHDWIAVDGVMFPTTWKFWNWTEDKGFFNLKGSVKIKNIRFLKASKDMFLLPQNAQEVGI